MQNSNLIPDIATGHYYVHLAACGAPVLNVPVQFADQASRVFHAYRDKYGFGASGMKAGCGDIYDSRNRVVGRISYNGRIWTSENDVVE